MAIKHPTAYETVAASQTNQVLGPGDGAQGDLLERVICVPAAVGAGVVSVDDGAGTEITLYAAGANLVDLKTFVIEVGARSRTGAWRLTTGANMSVVAVGAFT